MELNERQRELLARVLDELIPESADGRLPPAGALVASFVEREVGKTPALMAMVGEGLSVLDEQARARNPGGFAALPRAQRLELLNQQGFLIPLLFHTYAGYYQHEQVLAGLGLEARPPHPKGYELEDGDLSLLDPVRARAKMYRDV